MMKSFVFSSFIAVGLTGVLSSMGVFSDFKKSLDNTDQYEKVSLRLAKENRMLKQEISDLQYKLDKAESKSDYLALKLHDKHPSPRRGIASVAKTDYKDLVAFEVYKWTPDKLLAIGDKEFHFRNFEKSAQFFHVLLDKFPKHGSIDDRVLFVSGIAAYESGKHFKWASAHLKNLISKYPKSRYYRGAKLWLALAELKQGNKDHFVSTVEEFRNKYRNTEEWKILSQYYETFSTKIIR